MKKILLYIFALSTAALGQQFSHPLSAGGKSGIAAAADTLNVLAILVQFQTDDDDRTSGNGRFDLGVSATPLIDAPPHDSAYFADHFVFARNYFAKASNGKLNVAATVLGTVITLPGRMQEYAPVGSSMPLVQMVQEAWKQADSLYAGFPFYQYDMFVLFHAGVGKDIDLRGALGYDPTPYDIPSLYYNLNGFKNIFGGSFSGFPMAGNSFSITNTVVLPETEVRNIPSIGDDIILKLSINGLLVASIGSHIGLPDLFDTKTGKTAIGRFGLMDGQSMFSFAGICPPEPSAWEKSFLGWATSVEVLGNSSLSLPAAGLSRTAPDTVYKIPISAKEYFLAENRHRDVAGNGQTVTMRWKGETIVKTFTKDEEFFSNTVIDSIYGVVLDVDEPDWSLPGLINDENDYRGGILLWHIDESVIEKNFVSNSINADAQRRGVDLEEADGSQDIGQSYDLLSPGSGSEDGSPLDYWYDGNIVPFYKNEFSERTNPNSLSNLFARSHVTLKNFSARSPRMTFEANIGSADIQLAKVIKRNNRLPNNNDAPLAVDLNGDGSEEIVYTSGDSIYVLKNDFTPFFGNSTGLFSPRGGKFQPAFYSSSIAGNPFPRGVAAVSDSLILLFHPSDADSDNVADLYSSINVGDVITTPVYAADGLSHGLFTVGTATGCVVTADTIPTVTKVFSSPVIGVGESIAATADSLLLQGNKIRSVAPVISFSVVNTDAVVLTSNSIVLYDLTGASVKEEIRLNGEPTTTLAVHDLNQDKRGDVIVGIGNAVYAFNRNGAVVDHFPFRISAEDVVRGSIVASGNHILFGTKNGLIYAVTGSGTLVSGFPLQGGEMVSGPFVSGQYLLAASADSSLLIWKHASLFTVTDPSWRTFLGNVSHQSAAFFNDPAISRSTELLPKSLAYNWPNPVYGSTTNIRYFLGAPASVKITIINMAGELVQELTGTGDGGLDNEVEWDVSNIQSGVYYAQITASSRSGEQSQIIKIAVVK